MVFFFTCVDERYTVYMGKDKYENEELLKYGWPEDMYSRVGNRIHHAMDTVPGCKLRM